MRGRRAREVVESWTMQASARRERSWAFRSSMFARVRGFSDDLAQNWCSVVVLDVQTRRQAA